MKWVAGVVIGVGFVVAVAIVLVIQNNNSSPKKVNVTAGSTASPTSAASGTTTPTTSAVTDAAGKPCVAMKGTLPKGAPAVPIIPGPPPTTLTTHDIKVGTGATVAKDAKVTVNYIGVSCSTGEIFDSSWSRNQPFQADLSGGVIEGWQQGIPGMKVGGERELIIPPSLGYGAEGSPPTIAPNETLIFVVDVVSVP